MRRGWLFALVALSLSVALTASSEAQEEAKRIVFVAGTPSHGYGAHEHYAGCALLADSLRKARPAYEIDIYRNGWPKDEDAFAGADAIVMYCDGADGHPVLPNLGLVDRLADDGVGIVCIHYGVEVPAGDAGEHFLKWIGGYFEQHWSVNPHWTARFDVLPVHPITRGVHPFEINDEWYYHMRFRPQLQAVTPILTSLPPPSSLARPDGPRGGNPHVRAAIARGEPQHVAWAAERPGGGRGFGFTGGHVHWNWGDPNFRKLVLNAIAWTAQGTIPQQGIEDPPVGLEQLEANQDFDPPADFDREAVRRHVKLPGQPVAAAERHTAGNAVAQLRSHDSISVSLFASEPMMYNPTNIDIDHLGRVWVCEVINYRRFRNQHFPERDEGDRILVLQDTDHDGRADAATTFYQGRDVDSAHGICVLPDPESGAIRAIVSAQDSVFFLLDDDGDLRADRKELLFTGISGTEHDHGIHAFVFGPDGKLYFNFGNEGKQLRDRQGRPIIDLAGNEVSARREPYQQGMVFRCNLDGSELETLAWNFRNNWELAVDSYGTIWQSDNDDDGNRSTRINFVMEFGNYGYRDEQTGAAWKEERTNMAADIPSRHWHLNDPGVVPNLLPTGAGSPTGICVYEGTLLPSILQGRMIHCDAGPNLVRAYPVEPAGAGFRASRIEILDGTSNQWFRPTDVCAALDGSLMIADWYDPGVGGHLMEDVEHGRLFRVLPQDQAGRYRVPEFDFATARGAVEALQNPNLAVRSMAWRALHAMGADAEPALRELFESGRPRMRARALWLLGKLPDGGRRYVEAAWSHDDPNLRIVGIRLARQGAYEVIDGVRRLINDPSPHVRREVAIALRNNRHEDAATLWAQLAMQYEGQDRWYLEALGIGASGQWDRFLSEWLEAVGDGRMTPAGRDIVWRSRASLSPQLLAGILKDPETPLEEHPRYFRAFDFLTGPEKDRALESLLE